MQRRHSLRHLCWRAGVAAVSHALMVTGIYPLLPHALRVAGRRAHHTRPLRTALVEWGAALAVSAARPAGFLPLPGARTRGPRPVIVLHGYAMNRANFLALALRLRRAGLGPVLGFEYWTLGRVAAGARQLGWFIDDVLARTGATSVDVIGHSMGGVVARYYVAFAGGDGRVRHLITIGSPHAGTELSAMGVGYATRELVLGSQLTTRLGSAPPPQHTRTTVILSRGDALVPGGQQPLVPGAELLIYDDLGHISLLASRRVAAEIIARLREA